MIFADEATIELVEKQTIKKERKEYFLFLRTNGLIFHL
jgi:hypothetical protein